MPWNLVLGDAVAIGTAANIYNFSPIVIGDQVIISQDVFLCTGSHDYENPSMPLCHKPIMIESCAWVAAGAFVGPGVKVAEGTVVGARAVLVKDTAAWTVVAGNPARSLKRRTIGTKDSIGGSDKTFG